jgi:hypothetical protein
MELTVIVDGRAGAEPLHGLLGGVIIAGPQWHIACLICRARRINPESDTSALAPGCLWRVRILFGPLPLGVAAASSVLPTSSQGSFGKMVPAPDLNPNPPPGPRGERKVETIFWPEISVDDGSMPLT